MSVKTTKKDKDLDAFRKAINKKFGEGSIICLGDTDLKRHPCIPTGALSLDYATGIGGIPQGRITDIYGFESSGKSSLAWSIAKNAQKLGMRVLFIDVESGTDPNYTQKLGVSIEDIEISYPNCGEDALELLDIAVDSGLFGLVIFDSVAFAIPRAELDGEMGDAQMGALARMMGKAIRKIRTRVKETNTAVLFLNQLRNNMNCVSPNTLINWL